MCSVQEMATIYPDRVVAIRGPSVDSMSNAEAALSAKLRECHQRDYVSMTRVRYLIPTTTTTTTTTTTATTLSQYRQLTLFSTFYDFLLNDNEQNVFAHNSRYLFFGGNFFF